MVGTFLARFPDEGTFWGGRHVLRTRSQDSLEDYVGSSRKISAAETTRIGWALNGGLAPFLCRTIDRAPGVRVACVV